MKAYAYGDYSGNWVRDGTALRHKQDSFGLPTFFDAAGNAEVSEYTPTGTPMGGVTRSAVGNPFLFNGRQWDPESGMYFYRNRYLDPWAGRFTTQDPIGLWGDPLNMGNAYTYVGNDPINHVDPYGVWGWDNDWVQTAAEIFGAGYYMGTSNAAMHSFWVEDGGGLLSEMGNGVMAAGEFSSWTGAYNGAVDNAAAQIEQRIMMHMAVNGGDVNVAIVSASGFGMVLSDVLETTITDEFRTGYNYGNGATLYGLERTQRGLIRGAQLAGVGASAARFVKPPVFCRKGAVTGPIGDGMTGLADDIDILRSAAQGKGNFGLGQGKASDALRLGKDWVGEGYKIAGDGKTLVSKDGLRQFRPPTYKPTQGKVQANFERRFTPSGQSQGNGMSPGVG